MLKVFLFWPKRDKMDMILKGAFPPRKGFFTMKFSEMTYTRPDIDALLARCKELTAKAAAADSGEALVEVYYEQSRAFADYNTAANLANIHYTCDTRDAYWKAEQDFFDANGPAVSNASVEISRAFLANPHVDALTEAFGSTCVAGMKNAVLGMDERTVALQQEYNALVSTYQQIYGGALVELDGKQLTIPQLGPYKESTDAATRRAAYEAEAGYFDAHRAELDELYTKIVKNLNQQAQVMGFHDYSELSYVRMNRIGYGPEDIKRFRDQVARDVVPELQKVIALKNKRTGIQHPTFADLPVAFKDGNPKPIEGYDARMAAARTMYHELSPETAVGGKALHAVVGEQIELRTGADDAVGRLHLRGALDAEVTAQHHGLTELAGGQQKGSIARSVHRDVAEGLPGKVIGCPLSARCVVEDSAAVADGQNALGTGPAQPLSRAASAAHQQGVALRQGDDIEIRDHLAAVYRHRRHCQPPPIRRKGQPQRGAVGDGEAPAQQLLH